MLDLLGAKSLGQMDDDYYKRPVVNPLVRRMAMGGPRKVSTLEVVAIRDYHDEHWRKPKMLAAYYAEMARVHGVTSKSISKIARRVTYRDIP